MEKNVARPTICIPPRLEERTAPVKLDEPLSPLEGAASDFIEAAVAAGGLPVLMPMTHDEAVIEQYVALCDGLALPGGEDVDPKLWGVEEPYDESLLNHDRDALELSLIRAFRAADKPILATCRGMQLLNVAYGGTLDMAIEKRKTLPGTMRWRHTGTLSVAAHPVDIVKDSLLYRSAGNREQVQANSSHHCSVWTLGEGLCQSAQATDGIPEGIEDPHARFILGVQWHPEASWRENEPDAQIWRSFVAACQMTHEAA